MIGAYGRVTPTWTLKFSVELVQCFDRQDLFNIDMWVLPGFIEVPRFRVRVSLLQATAVGDSPPEDLLGIGAHGSHVDFPAYE